MVIVNLRNWWLSSAMMAAIMKTALILSRSFHLLFCLCPRPRNSLLSYFFFSYWLFKAKAKAFKSDAADTRWRSCVTWFKRGKICNPVASTKGGKICYHRLFVATDVHHAGKRACHLNSFLVDEITKLGNCVSPGASKPGFPLCGVTGKTYLLPGKFNWRKYYTRISYSSCRTSACGDFVL